MLRDRKQDPGRSRFDLLTPDGTFDLVLDSTATDLEGHPVTGEVASIPNEQLRAALETGGAGADYPQGVVYPSAQVSDAKPGDADPLLSTWPELSASTIERTFGREVSLITVYNPGGGGDADKFHFVPQTENGGYNEIRISEVE